MPPVVWLIPLFPLLGTVVNAVLGGAIGRRAHWVAVPAIACSFVAACLLLARVGHGETWTGDLFPWISAGTFKTAVTAQVDPLSAVMLLVVTGVSFLIHLYSVGYMHDDPGYARFFTYLNLFVFSMVMLVLAGNFLLLYVFWEGVGLCSYLLIGFWYTRPAAAQAGKKAFIVNRVGDFGFGLGIMWLWSAVGTLDYAGVFKAAAALPPATATGIALLLFMGACGKSAQLPLHTWLPDAMEGPTPVSALIHAATMVTAGVYMVARSHAIFERSPVALEVVAWVGLAGLPGLAGFFSKDEILAAAFVSGHRVMWALLLLGAFLTTFYTARMLFLAFYSGPRMSKEAAHRVHESPRVMTLPLTVLALLTVITGVLFGIPSDQGTRFARFLAPVFPVHEGGHSGLVALMLLVMAVAVFAAGVALAWVRYMASPVRADEIGRPKTALHRWLLDAYYVDALYDRLIVRPLLALSEFLARVFDLWLIDGLVNALGRAVVAGATRLRRIQTGFTVNYALTMLGGAVAIVVFLLSR